LEENVLVQGLWLHLVVLDRLFHSRHLALDHVVEQLRTWVEGSLHLRFAFNIGLVSTEFFTLVNCGKSLLRISFGRGNFGPAGVRIENYSPFANSLVI